MQFSYLEDQYFELFVRKLKRSLAFGRSAITNTKIFTTASEEKIESIELTGQKRQLSESFAAFFY